MRHALTVHTISYNNLRHVKKMKIPIWIELRGKVSLLFNDRLETLRMLRLLNIASTPN